VNRIPCAIVRERLHQILQQPVFSMFLLLRPALAGSGSLNFEAGADDLAHGAPLPADPPSTLASGLLDIDRSSPTPFGLIFHRTEKFRHRRYFRRRV